MIALARADLDERASPRRAVEHRIAGVLQGKLANAVKEAARGGATLPNGPLVAGAILGRAGAMVTPVLSRVAKARSGGQGSGA